MPVRLRDAADSPAKITEDFPVIQFAAVDVFAARFLISFQKFLDCPDAAETLCILAKAPRTNARPSQVLRRVADVSEFPIENPAQSIRTDHQVADTKIAVHQDGRIAG